MKISKDIRQLSRTLVRDSYVDGALNRDKINSIVRTIIEKKPRNYIQLLENYQRLLRLEVEKRRATIESAAELDPEAGRQIVAGLEQKYGPGLATEYVVNPGAPRWSARPRGERRVGQQCAQPARALAAKTLT